MPELIDSFAGTVHNFRLRLVEYGTLAGERHEVRAHHVVADGHPFASAADSARACVHRLPESCELDELELEGWLGVEDMGDGVWQVRCGPLQMVVVLHDGVPEVTLASFEPDLGSVDLQSFDWDSTPG